MNVYFLITPNIIFHGKCGLMNIVCQLSWLDFKELLFIRQYIFTHITSICLTIQTSLRQLSFLLITCKVMKENKWNQHFKSMTTWLTDILGCISTSYIHVFAVLQLYILVKSCESVLLFTFCRSYSSFNSHVHIFLKWIYVCYKQ